MRKSYNWPIILIITVLAIFAYGLLHLVNLNALPVFADEAIYIRWAQLILDDAKQYWLFPMNDGKTPLFVWSMVPVLNLVRDQLLAGRLVSVIVGFIQAVVVGSIAWKLTKNQFSALWAILLTTVLPFWFFYQRMALMDTLLTLFLSLSLLVVLILAEKIKATQLDSHSAIVLVVVLALFLFLAIWTKLPAVLFFLPLLPIGLMIKQTNPRQYLVILGLTLIGIALALLLFLITSVLPAFSQLFSRGGDFLFSLTDFLGGAWRVMFANTGLTLQTFTFYLGPLILISPLIGLFFPGHRRQQAMLILATLAFTLPMVLLAKVYYPRYLLPASLFITLSSSLLVATVTAKLRTVSLQKKALLALGLALYCANTLAFAGQWDYLAMFKVDLLPLVAVDRQQYLEEWSSGHGIAETIALLQSEDKSQRIAVATEGFFGTLPDALLLYLHNQDVSNLSVDGIGQPVREIPQWFLEKSKSADQTWLVVNSHRMLLQLPPEMLLIEYCRPNQAPCLQIWNITEYTRSLIEK